MIALIYEGPKAEYNIFKKIKEVFFSKSSIVEISLNDSSEVVDAAYGGNIFDFYNSIAEDPDIDIIALIQERIQRNQSLAIKYAEFLKCDRNMFSEIYLFFDFEIHHTLNNDRENNEIKIQEELDKKIKILKSMLNIFSNETENGKLYLNYPMIESLRDIKKNNVCCERCCESLNDLANYKAIVHSSTHDFSDYRKLGQIEWGYFARHALQKANCVVNNCYQVCTYDIFIKQLTQVNIFDVQIDYCKNQRKVFILSSIPLFLLEYYGALCWNESGLINNCLSTYSLSFSFCSENRI